MIWSKPRLARRSALYIVALTVFALPPWSLMAQESRTESISIDEATIKLDKGVLTWKFKIDPLNAKVTPVNWSYRLMVDSPTGRARSTRFITQDMIGPVQSYVVPPGNTGGTLVIELARSKPPLVVRTLPIKLVDNVPPHQQLIGLINVLRMNQGKPPLIENAMLRAAASFHCKEMLESGIFASNINGSTLATRLKEQGITVTPSDSDELLSKAVDPQSVFNEFAADAAKRRRLLASATDIGAFRLATGGEARWTVVILDLTVSPKSSK